MRTRANREENFSPMPSRHVILRAEALTRTALVRHALNRCDLPETVSVADARASFARSGAGDGWLAIGDARIAPDPLSGQGIIWAIDDAASVMELLTRKEWRDFAQELRVRTLREVEAYVSERSRVYLSEQRFRHDAYWSTVSSSLAHQSTPNPLD